MYRVIKRNTPLNSGHKYGDIIQDGEFKPAVIEALLRNKIIARASTPPLAELPTWEKRAEKLKAIGIVTVQDLLDTDADVIREKLGYKRSTVIKKWQENARAWISDSPPLQKK